MRVTGAQDPQDQPVRPSLVEMKRLRSCLLLGYKMLVGMIGVLPRPMRARVDSWFTFILQRLANAPDRVVEARLSDAIDVLTAREGVNQLGDYLEFGVCFGASLACMHRVLLRRGIQRMRMFGFDSFEGLPDVARTDDGGYWSPRMFASDLSTTRRFLTKAGVDWSRVTLVEGWFSATLTADLVVQYRLCKASVIMVDCDMYSSARLALDFCRPLIREQAVIIFDDWYSGGLDERNLGEKRAFDEFLRNGEFEAESLGRYTPNAKVFNVVRRQTRASLGSA